MKRIVLEMNEAGAVYGPNGWYIGESNSSEHFGEADSEQSNEKQRKLMRLIDNGLTPEQIIDLKREGLL